MRIAIFRFGVWGSPQFKEYLEQRRRFKEDMSYAIIRNDKLTRMDAQGSYIHNDRRSKGHSNKDIDPTKTHLNFWCKKNELTYIKEFDKMRKEYDLKGTIRSNSNIMCEMMITSDNAFFNKIGLEETKRYFKESYKFVCNYKNLGEKYIVSAAVHLDETTPHMHFVNKIFKEFCIIHIFRVPLNCNYIFIFNGFYNPIFTFSNCFKTFCKFFYCLMM